MLVSRMPGTERERGDVEIGLAEHVVEVNPRAGHDDARAAARRARQRGGVAVCVEHADLGCPGGSGRPSGTRRVCHLAAARPPSSTRRTAPPRYSARSNAGVRCAFAERSARRHAGDRGGRERLSQRGPCGEHGQRMGDQGTARGWRRVRDEDALAIGQRDRPASDRAVGGEVGGGQAAAGGGLVGDERVRGLAVDQLARAVDGDAFQCVGQRRVARAVAGSQRGERRPEHARALGRGAEKALEQLDHVRVRRRELHPAAGERDRRLRELPPGQPAEPAVGLLESCRDAGHGARPRPDEEDLLPGAEVDDVGLQRGNGPSRVSLARHGHEAVDGERPAARGVVGDEKAAAAWARQRRLGDPGGEGRCDARVDGRSAGAQHLGPDLRRDRVACGDRTPRGGQRNASLLSRAGRMGRRDRRRRSRARATASDRASARVRCASCSGRARSRSRSRSPTTDRRATRRRTCRR